MTRLIIFNVFFKVLSGGVSDVFPFLDGLFRGLDGFLPLFAKEIDLVSVDDRNGRNEIGCCACRNGQGRHPG